MRIFSMSIKNRNSLNEFKPSSPIKINTVHNNTAVLVSFGSKKLHSVEIL